MHIVVFTFVTSLCLPVCLSVSMYVHYMSVCQYVCVFGSRDPLGPNPAFRRLQRVSFRFENRLPVPEHQN